MSKKSAFKGLFSKSDSKKNDASDVDALDYLQQLLDAHLGQNTRLDVEINKFIKLLKVGSGHDDIVAQLDILLAHLQKQPSAQSNVTPQDIDWFKNLPAPIFVAALIEEPLDASLKVQLKYYLKGLDSNLTASDVLGEIISLLEPKNDVELFDNDNNNEQASSTPEPSAAADIHAIKQPVIKLLSKIQQDEKLAEEAATLLAKAESVDDNNALCSLLEDTSKLVLTSLNNTSGQFEHFLLSLKERLDKVDSFVSQQAKTNQAIADCGDQLSDNMNLQVGDLQYSIDHSDSLADLEKHVSTSIESILTEIESFNNSREPLQKDASQQIQELEEQLANAKDEAESLRNNLQQQRHRAMTDSLTHLPNRQSYDERLQLEYHRWQRYNKPLSLVMADLDHFKNINDSYGHTCGDYVLKEIADCFVGQMRETDFVARFGGEEFVLLLPETNIKEAVIAMNKIRMLIAQLEMRFGEHRFNINMSFGVATFEAKDDYNLVFNRADTALYRAKSRGRNQVCAELKKSV